MNTAFTGPLALLPSYVYWHYALASKRVWKIASDFSWFLWRFFAMDFMVETLHTRWWGEQEMSWWVSAAVMLAGLIMRVVFIILGLAAQMLLWILAGVALAMWLVLPVLVAYLVFAGIVFTLRPL